MKMPKVVCYEGKLIQQKILDNNAIESCRGNI